VRPGTTVIVAGVADPGPVRYRTPGSGTPAPFHQSPSGILGTPRSTLKKVRGAASFRCFVLFVVPSSDSFPADRLARQMRFILEADKLKEVLRQSLLTQSRRRENDAEHSWHLCLMVLVLGEHADFPALDRLRVLKLLLLHDLVEIDAGDTFAYDTAALTHQRQRETLGAERLFGLLPDDQAAEFRALWEEFEARSSPEAVFAAALDRLQPMFLNAHTGGAAWQRHGVTSDQVLARADEIRAGSLPLWDYAARMIAAAVAAGHLAR
jgi:putative hydrolase of HD superfamily